MLNHNQDWLHIELSGEFKKYGWLDSTSRESDLIGLELWLVVLKSVLELSDGLLKMGIVGPPTESLWFSGQGWVLRFCRSNKFTGDAEASLGSILWELYSDWGCELPVRFRGYVKLNEETWSIRNIGIVIDFKVKRGKCGKLFYKAERLLYSLYP